MKRFAILTILFTLLTVNAYSQAKQFLEIWAHPLDAELEINGEVKERKNGIYYELLPLGIYHCRLSCENFSTMVFNVHLTDPYTGIGSILSVRR